MLTTILFVFVKIVGTSGRLVPAPVTFDLSAIDRRIRSLQDISSSSEYYKQKQSLKSELERFLYALPGRKSLLNATPWDVCRFLAYKDSNGRIRVHTYGCPSFGQKGSSDCHCPFRLSYNTVDSYIGKLRSIFNESGRQGDWNRTLTLEQLQARITPKQATPFLSTSWPRSPIFSKSASYQPLLRQQSCL